MARGRSKPTGRTVRPSGVNFEVVVLDYLETLSLKQDRSRSWLLNAMVREHAARHGVELLAVQPEMNGDLK